MLRGEWQGGAYNIAFFHIASEDKLGLIADGKACALAYSAWMAGVIRECEPAKDWGQFHQSDHQNAILKLPREQAEFMSLATSGLFQWKDGYERAWLINAQHQAALELLMLEKAGKPLAADSIRGIIDDPLSGDPFIFDPVKRTLDAPAGSSRHLVQTLVLPW